MTPPALRTNTHVDFKFKDVTMENWTQVDLPSATLNIAEIDHFDAKGSPTKAKVSGNMAWNTINATRLYDEAEYKKLIDMMIAHKDKGTDDKEDYELHVCGKDNAQLTSYTLKGAYIQSVNATAQSAAGNEIKTIQVAVHFDDCEVVK